MARPCVICQIIKGEHQAYTVFEDENFIGFLDIHPLFIGHCLLAPKNHVETMYELAPDLGNAFLSTLQSLGRAVMEGMQAEGSFIAINNKVSQSVPHLHVHVVPRNKGDGLKGFFWPRNRYENEAHFRLVQEKISKCF